MAQWACVRLDSLSILLKKYDRVLTLMIGNGDDQSSATLLPTEESRAAGGVFVEGNSERMLKLDPACTTFVLESSLTHKMHFTLIKSKGTTRATSSGAFEKLKLSVEVKPTANGKAEPQPFRLVFGESAVLVGSVLPLDVASMEVTRTHLITLSKLASERFDIRFPAASRIVKQIRDLLGSALDRKQLGTAGEEEAKTLCEQLKQLNQMLWHLEFDDLATIRKYSRSETTKFAALFKGTASSLLANGPLSKMRKESLATIESSLKAAETELMNRLGRLLDSFDSVGAKFATIATSDFSQSIVASVEEASTCIKGQGEANITATLFGSSPVGMDMSALLRDAIRVLSPIAEAFPFGKCLIDICAGIFKAFCQRADLLEAAEKIGSKITLLLRVLQQRGVRDLIREDESTKDMLKQLILVMDDCRAISFDYAQSNTLYQLFAASSSQQALMQKSAEIDSLFQQLHDMTSLRMMSKVREHQAFTQEQLVTILASLDHLQTLAMSSGNAPQDSLMYLEQHINDAEQRTADAIRLAAGQTEEAIRTMEQHTLQFVMNTTEKLIESNARQLAEMRDIHAKVTQEAIAEAVKTATAVVNASTLPSMTSLQMAELGRSIVQYAKEEFLPDALVAASSQEEEKERGRRWEELVEKQNINTLETFREVLCGQLNDVHRQLVDRMEVDRQANLVDFEQVSRNIAQDSSEKMNDRVSQLQRACEESADAMIESLTEVITQRCGELELKVEGVKEAILQRLEAVDSNGAANNKKMLQKIDAVCESVTAGVCSAMRSALQEQQAKFEELLNQSQRTATTANDERLIAVQEAQTTMMQTTREGQAAALDRLRSMESQWMTMSMQQRWSWDSFSSQLRDQAELVASTLIAARDTQRQVADLSETMKVSLAEQAKSLSEIRGMVSAGQATVEKVIASFPQKMRDVLVSDILEVRKDLVKAQEEGQQTLLAVVESKFDRLFEKFTLRELADAVLKPQEQQLKNFQKDLGEDVTARVQDLLASQSRLIAHDLDATEMKLSARMSALVAQINQLGSDAVKSAVLEALEEAKANNGNALTEVNDLERRIEHLEGRLVKVISEAAAMCATRLEQKLDRMHKEVSSQRYFICDPTRDDPRHPSRKHLIAQLHRGKYSVGALRAELRKAYCLRYQNYASAFSSQILHADTMFTSLRLVQIPLGESSKAQKTDDLTGATFDSSEIVHVVRSCDETHSLMLIEGRAGIGKTTFAMQLCRLQTYDEGFVVMVTLSELMNYVRGQDKGQHNVSESLRFSLSPMELIYLSLRDETGCRLSMSTIEMIFFCGAPIVWVVDGLDEVQLSDDKFISHFLKSFTTTVGRKANSPQVRKQDCVIITSREERSSKYNYEDLPLMVINPWTSTEVGEFVDKFFSQTEVKLTMKQSNTTGCRVKIMDTIQSGVLGSFATLPIIIEMLCWTIATDSTKNITSATQLYRIALENLYQRAVNKPRSLIRHSESAPVFSLCEVLAMDAMSKGDPQLCLELTSSDAHHDLYYSGLVRAVTFGTNRPVVRFSHKSILEFFAARYYSTHMPSLLDLRWSADPPFEKSDKSVKILTFTEPDLLVRVDVTKSLPVVTFCIDCERNDRTLDIFWLRDDEVKEFERYKTSSTISRALNRFSGTSPFNTFDYRTSQPFTCKKGTLAEGTYYAVVTANAASNKPAPVIIELSGEMVGENVVVSTRKPPADIQEDKQQRNFFSLLAQMLNEDPHVPAERQALLSFVLSRFRVHLNRIRGSFDRDQRVDPNVLDKAVTASVSSPSGPSSPRSSQHATSNSTTSSGDNASVSNASLASSPSNSNTSKLLTSTLVNSSSSDISRAEFFRKASGIDLIIELSAISREPEQYCEALDDVSESSSLFGRFKEVVSLQTQSFYFWMIVPCARFGASMMLEFVEKKLGKSVVAELRSGVVYKEALIQSMIHRHLRVQRYLEEKNIQADLAVACSVGAEEAVRSILNQNPDTGSMQRALAEALQARQFNVVHIVLETGCRLKLLNRDEASATVVSKLIESQQSAASTMMRHCVVNVIRAADDALRAALLKKMSDRVLELSEATRRSLVADPSFRRSLADSREKSYPSLVLTLHLNRSWNPELLPPSTLARLLEEDAALVAIVRDGRNSVGQCFAHECAAIRNFNLLAVIGRQPTLASLLSLADSKNLLPCTVALRSASDVKRLEEYLSQLMLCYSNGSSTTAASLVREALLHGFAVMRNPPRSSEGLTVTMQQLLKKPQFAPVVVEELERGAFEEMPRDVQTVVAKLMSDANVLNATIKLVPTALSLALKLTKFIPSLLSPSALLEALHAPAILKALPQPLLAETATPTQSLLVAAKACVAPVDFIDQCGDNVALPQIQRLMKYMRLIVESGVVPRNLRDYFCGGPLYDAVRMPSDVVRASTALSMIVAAGYPLFKADLTKRRYVNATLSAGLLMSAKLSGVVLENCDLSDADISFAEVQDMNAVNCTGYDSPPRRFAVTSMSANGSLVVVTAEGRGVILWDTQTGEEISSAICSVWQKASPAADSGSSPLTAKFVSMTSNGSLAVLYYADEAAVQPSKTSSSSSKGATVALFLCSGRNWILSDSLSWDTLDKSPHIISMNDTADSVALALRQGSVQVHAIDSQGKWTRDNVRSCCCGGADVVATCVSWSHGAGLGTMLAVGSEDCAVRIFRFVGKSSAPPSVLECRGHQDRVSSVAFSPDNTRMVSSAGDVAIVWSAEGQKLVELRHPPGTTISAASFFVSRAGNGSAVITGCEIGVLRTWDIATAKEQDAKGIRCHGSNIVAIKAVPSTGSVFCCSDEGAVSFWQRRQDTLIALPRGPAPVVLACRSVDVKGKTYLMAEYQDGTQCAWDAGTLREVHRAKKTAPPPNSSPMTVTLSTGAVVHAALAQNGSPAVYVGQYFISKQGADVFLMSSSELARVFRTGRFGFLTASVVGKPISLPSFEARSTSDTTASKGAGKAAPPY